MPSFFPDGADRRVEIIEVGTRDGLQIEHHIVPAVDKIALINRMIDAGIRHIEVTSFVSPKAVPQLADAEEVLAGIRKRPDTNLMALVPNVRAAERALKTPVDGGVLLCSASDTHNRKNLNRSIAASLEGMRDVADLLQGGGKEVHGAIATAFGCPFEGEVTADNVLRIAEAYMTLGAQHLTLGDTTGMATPRNIRDTVALLRREFPGVDLCLHLHNTRGVGLANVLAGLEMGVRRFDASVGGLGGCPFAAGATGNICTEDLVYLLDECGWESGVSLEGAMEVAHQMEALLGKPLPGQVMRAGRRLRLHAADDVVTASG
ncbi:hydroxymethylglutaryl-CoA lyase [Acidovorax sp. SRB_24]|uniref:hydroxymethylglutaryl-CoA lyase n=1 Tax=Acidovorax sp. SRB_24 TaxID=1962700 RepID=UPI00145E4C24|nr:hydroxymethylglutaryl-CoA lyase [Acidovorax sp. SRB_24]NMM78892.1 hydroxymethylglutaryl-CoA lyase [Acidovorax sp. SRB_24]